MPIELKFILEALLFSAAKPLSVAELREVLNKTAAEEEAPPETVPFKKQSVETLEAALNELSQEHEAAGRSYRLVCVAGSWQFVTQPEYGPWLKTFVGVKSRPARLSQPGLETLAVVAYRQPVTRAEIEQIRGVAVDGVMATLKERGLIAEVGRAEVIGRPMQYGTTPAFLEYFGLAALEDLPAADELRRIPVVRPESLATAEGPAAETPPLPLDTPATSETPTEAPPSVDGAPETSSSETTEPTSESPAEASPSNEPPPPA